MKRSFTLRVTVRFAVLVLLTTTLVLATGGWLLWRQSLARLTELNAVEHDELATVLGPAPLPPEQVAQRIRQYADTDSALFFVQIRDAGGQVMFRSSNMGPLFLPIMPDGEAQREARLDELGHVLISNFRTDPWRMQIASRLEPTEQMLASYARVSAFLLAGVALLSVALGYQFSRATLRPVRAIEATARRIRADNLSERIPVAAGHGELTALIELLNGTFDRLQRSFEQVSRFTAEASHELKTPLALARLNAEKLQSRVRGEPESEALIAEVLDEIARLNHIIESLLFLARTEGGALKLEHRPLELAGFLRDFAADAAVLAEDAGVRFALARNDAATVCVEPGLIRQLLLNLVGNALAVAEAGAVITLESQLEGDRCRLVLTDEGPGLPPDQLERVFERFVRYEGTARREGHTGSGLGLAICRGIAELHGGRISAENRGDRRGLRVSVWLPATA